MSPTEPRIIHHVSELQRYSDAVRSSGKRVALVPTMGALHAGHVSLVASARGAADRVIVSIFVNPTQFGPGEDFERYPRDTQGDIAKLRHAGADIVFMPSVEEMYPEGNSTWVDVDGVTDGMCGRGRPGHFRGVTTIVARLFNAAKPHVAVFGEKDYQQLAAIRRMAQDLRMDVEVLGAPTVRDPDGLAMSSRNAYLSVDARRQAACLNAALYEVREAVRAGERSVRVLEKAARDRIEKEPLAEIEYIEVRDVDGLRALTHVRGRAVAAVAVRFEGTRLIDNTVVEGA